MLYALLCIYVCSYVYAVKILLNLNNELSLYIHALKLATHPCHNKCVTINQHMLGL